MGNSTLFVFIRAGDYVPDALAEFAAAIENPIAYQSKLEKHAQQLAVLEEDDELDGVGTCGVPEPRHHVFDPLLRRMKRGNC
jgi:hypothetical protein